MKVIEGLYYTEDHEWLKVEGNTGLVGITDHAQDLLGDIVYVELPEVGAGFEAGEAFGSIESVKVASDLMLPVAGTVTEKNEAAESGPEAINSDPYGTWLVKITISAPSQTAALMGAEAYAQFSEE
jgi:glycine cleavage system H protein